MSYEYECALSGVKSQGLPLSDEELGDLPLGWTQITVQRRLPNPKYIAIQQVKAATVEGVLLQFDEAQRDEQRPFVALQIEAQFRALENDTPPYLTDIADMIFVSESDEVNDALNEVRQSLGLEPVPSFTAVQQRLFGTELREVQEDVA